MGYLAESLPLINLLYKITMFIQLLLIASVFFNKLLLLRKWHSLLLLSEGLEVIAKDREREQDPKVVPLSLQKYTN